MLRAFAVLAAGAGIGVMFDALGVFEGCSAVLGAVVTFMVIAAVVDWRRDP